MLLALPVVWQKRPVSVVYTKKAFLHPFVAVQKDVPARHERIYRSIKKQAAVAACSKVIDNCIKGHYTEYREWHYR